MVILNYTKFLESKYEYGCVMIDLYISNWNELLESIDSEDIYNNGENLGLVKRPHLTLLYGLHKEVSDKDVLNCFKGFEIDNFKIKIKGISIFENPEFDVVKLGVENNKTLIEINRRLSKLPNSNQFPEYKPHLTLAYLKRGSGKKYENPEYSYQIKNIKKIVYSRPDNTELIINI
jgi:2'-5' RNA ligase